MGILLVFMFTGAELKYCAPGDTSVGCEQCPDATPWVDCGEDPCVMERELGCPLHKNDNPVCVPNQCGACRVEWYIPSGKRVYCWAF